MPPRDWRFRVEDILAAIDKITEYARGLDQQTFSAELRTIEAVCFNFAIIGEAASKLPESITSGHPELPWRLMQDMRNFVVHSYWGINPDVLWDTIHRDLPPLVAPLRQILDNSP
jgi:uncharacterized protein with HEPN domain